MYQAEYYYETSKIQDEIAVFLNEQLKKFTFIQINVNQPRNSKVKNIFFIHPD